jgi:tetratricopeptide (TPR) repeat protein
MATIPPASDAWQSQPSIIIDPSIYVADASSDPLRIRVLGALGTMVWATAAGLVISVTVFAITLSNDWLIHGINHEENHVSLSFAFGQDAQREAEAANAVRPKARKTVERPAVALVSTTDEPKVVQAPLAPAPLASEPEAGGGLLEIQAALKEARRCLNARRYDEAEQAFREVLATRPNHPGALSGMARINLVRGELDPALGLARRAVSVAPAHAVYHAVLGDVLRASGESAAADLEYEAASRLSQGAIDRVAKALPANPYAAQAQGETSQAASADLATEQQPATGEATTAGAPSQLPAE